ncbi:DUF1254 domain-containing protein [Achromobacter insuavis]
MSTAIPWWPATRPCMPPASIGAIPTTAGRSTPSAAPSRRRTTRRSFPPCWTCAPVPVVVSVPPMEARRYHALRLTDLYGFNFAYLGSRATGNGGGRYLVAGPRWNGAAPTGIATVIRAETELVSLAGRIQRFSSSDQANVKRIEAGYRIQPLSAYLKKKPPPAPATIEWLAPESPAQMRTSLEFYNQLGFLLQFAPAAHSEKSLRKRLDSMRIRPGAPAVAEGSNPRLRQVMQEGMHDGQNEIDKRRLALDGKADTLFGDRRTLGNDYLARAIGAQVGLGTDSREESITTVLATDAAGQPLDGAQPYTLRFAPRALPPVNAFWSVTLQRPAGAAQASTPSGTRWWIRRCCPRSSAIATAD